MRSRWAIFISGAGSNLHAAIEMILEIDLILVVSSQSDAYGLQRARRNGIETLILEKKIDWENLNSQLKMRKIDCLLLLGFMKIIPKDFCESWQGKIWNLHPSLLPSYKGSRALERSFNEGAPMGVSLHEVTEELDGGKVILWQEVPREKKQTSMGDRQYASKGENEFNNKYDNKYENEDVSLDICRGESQSEFSFVVSLPQKNFDLKLKSEKQKTQKKQEEQQKQEEQENKESGERVEKSGKSHKQEMQKLDSDKNFRSVSQRMGIAEQMIVRKFFRRTLTTH